MSLKAKIEAVVYASEEPVTLVQLAGLFTEDVLTLQRNSLPATAPPVELSNPVSEAELPLIAAFDEGAMSASTPLDEKRPEEPSPNVDREADLPPGAAIDEGATGEEAPLDPETGEPVSSASTSGGEEKRIARQRDREVRGTLQGILEELISSYAADDRGIEIREIAGGYRFATKPECHDAVRGFVKRLKPPMKLTLQSLETLAVIAYKQPVTAPEVSEIRGVDSGGVLGSLMARKLITTAGRKQVIGRPILYKTTKEFLLRFGLRDLAELPSIEEFEKMAGELAETDESIEAGDAEPQPESSLNADRELPFGGEELTIGSEPMKSNEEDLPSSPMLEEAVQADRR